MLVGEGKMRLTLSVVLGYDVIIDCLTTTVSRRMRIVEVIPITTKKNKRKKKFDAPSRFRFCDFSRHSFMFIELPRVAIEVMHV